QLDSYEVNATSGRDPHVEVKLTRGGEQYSATQDSGDGPLDALFHAIEKITGKEVLVTDFRVQSATRGKDAQGESVIEVQYNGHVYRGRGVSTDTVEAASRAFVNAINRIEIGAKEIHRLGDV